MNANISKQKQTFSFNAPTAASVSLAADFTHWQKHPLALRKQAGGVWKATTSLAPGTYHYRFLVDGEWRDDPACTLRVGNPFGSQDAVRVVSAPQQKAYRHPSVSARVWNGP